MINDIFVAGIKLAAVEALIPIMDRHPILETIFRKNKHSSSNWDFFMTVAGVGMYFLTNEVSKEEYAEIMNQLTELDKQMEDAINNLFSYTETLNSEDIKIQTVIGFWVLWNITGEPPTDDESNELAPVIGMCLYNVINSLN